MYCNGCLNRYNHDICSECVGFDLYRSDVSSNPFLAIDIDDEMQMLANLLLNIEIAERKHDMRIEKVIFKYPATVVLWADGTKTIVKAGDYDIFDPEKGLAMAIAKKALGNEGNYYKVFKKWLPKEKVEEELSPKPSIEPIVKNVKVANIGEEGLLVEGELTKTGEKFFEKRPPESYLDGDPVRLLTAEELAEELGVTKATINRKCRQGKYPGALKVNGKWQIPWEV